MPTASTPVDERSETSTGRVVYVAVVGALGGFLFGYDSAVINGANDAIEGKFGISQATLGWVVAAALIAAAAGCWFSGTLANKFGRKKVALTAAVLFTIAGFGQAFPLGIGDFIVWRLLGGFAIGVASVVSPMYIAEISPRRMRGTLTALFQFAIVIGIFATGLGNYLLVEAAGGSSTGPLWGLQAWQWMFLLMIVPSAIYFLLTLTIPESPRYLVQKGRIDEARGVLSKLYGSFSEGILADIRASFKKDPNPRLSDLRGPRFGLLPIVWIGILISLFQQFVGINAVIYYSNLIYQAVGLDQSDAFLTSMITTGVNFAFTIVALVLIDRVGRKKLLLVGSAGMAVCLVTIAIVFASAPKCTEEGMAHLIDGCTQTEIGQPMVSHGAGLVAVFAVNLFIAFFASTWGPVAWVLISEMFPNRIRAAALSVAAMAQWLGNFVVSATFPGLAKISIALTYGVFTVFALLSIWFVLAKVRETKGISLEAMDKLDGAEAAA